jgi:hypothetical protein
MPMEDIVVRAGLVLIALTCLLLLVSAVLNRRHRAHLARIAAKHSMSLVSGVVPAVYADKAGRHQGSDRKASLADLILGSGATDGLFFALRRIGRTRQQLLYFELETSASLESFYVVPAGQETSGESRLSLHWCATRNQWSNEKALSMAARIMYSVSSLGSRGSMPEIGVEVQGRKVWIHSLRRLRGADLDRFVEDALRLRQLLRKSLERTRGISQRSGKTPAVSNSRPAVVSMR